MEQFRKFLRDKAFALVLTACLLAAAAAGVWAVRTVRNELKKDLDAVRSPSSTAPGIDEGINTSPGVAGEEEAEWQQQNAPAANSVANVPKADSSSGGAASSSGARSGSGSVREPSALQTESLPASSSAAPASTQPVSGRVLNSYSGDELVYNKTLGDWRTHNGVDYAADKGAEVTAPAAGKVVETGSSQDIFYRPRHPYTKALLRAVPRLDTEEEQSLESIEGTPPNMIDPPAGCAFSTRCAQCMRICQKSEPPMFEFEDGHTAQCWLYHPMAAQGNEE